MRVERDAVADRSASSTSAGTCSWSKVTTSQPPGEVEDGRDVGVVTHRRGGDDEGGRGDLGLGEHAERDPELGRRAGAHPGELAAADDADDREATGSAGRGGSPGEDICRRGYDARVLSPLTGPLDRLRGAVAVLYREMIKFGVVGAVAFVIDLGGANLLWHTVLTDKVTTAKIISGAVAPPLFAWLGNRQWTFRHRRSRPVHHEVGLFFARQRHRPRDLGRASSPSRTTASASPAGSPTTSPPSSGIGLGTLFRFWAYRRFVFAGEPIAPESEHLLPG